MLCTGTDTALCNAAWQNPPAAVAAVFARVLQRDYWGLRQVVVACLSTGDKDATPSPKKSNYQYFKDAITPADEQQADTDTLNTTP